MPEPETLRARRRAEIVAVARKIVAEEGLEALTFGALEGRLAFTRGVVTYHFKNKDDIVHAVLEDAIQEINAGTRARLRDDLGPEQRLGVVLRTYVRGFIERQDAVRVLFSFWGRLASDKKARKANAALYSAYRRGRRPMH
jgi:AcrR family transcriptional regulator